MPFKSMVATRVTRAFPLAGEGLVWCIAEGKLDVFLAPMADGQPTGALTHITRVEAGSAVFSMPFADGFGFLAAPAAETTVYAASLQSLSQADLD